MALYKDGTITLTSGSDLVQGSGTAFLANVSEGASLCVPGSIKVRLVIKIIDDVTLRVHPPFKSRPGNVYSGLAYTITDPNFTPTLSLPCPGKHDLDSSSVLNRAWGIIDRELPLKTP